MTPRSERWISLVDEVSRAVLELTRGIDAPGGRRAELYREVMFSLLASLPPPGTPEETSRALRSASCDVTLHAEKLGCGSEDEVVELEAVAHLSEDDPEARLIQREQARALVEKIPSPERDVLELSALGFSLHEIHEETGFPLSTVHQRLERALRTARKHHRSNAVSRPAARPVE